VFFDGNSGTATSTIGANITVSSVNCTGYTGTLAISSAAILTLSGGGAAQVLTLVTGMTFSPNASAGAITFTYTGGTFSLTPAGKGFPSVTVNGAGGTVQLQGDLLINTGGTAVLTLTAGEFDANNHNVTAPNFAGSNANTRTLNMGSGTWTINRPSGAATVWDFTTTTGLTFNKGTGLIIIGGTTFSATTAANLNFKGGGQTFNNVTFASPSSGQFVYFIITGVNTFNALTVQPGARLGLAANQTVTSLSLAGTAVAPIYFGNDGILGTAITAQTVTMTSGTVSATWCELAQLTMTGGGTFNAVNSFNGGGLSGWNLTPPQDSTTQAAVASAVWKDLLAGGDFGTAGSVGALFTSAGVATSSNKKKNTASAGFMFVMVSSTTGLPQTGLTVTSQVSLDGGAFASTTNAVTELSNGVYILNLSAADTNGNHVMLRFTATGANAFFAEIVTQP
jgi:hypothetical protein